MRVLILSYLKKDSKKHSEILKKLEGASVSKGNQVEIRKGDVDLDQVRFPMYEYIAVVTPSSALFGAKVPEKLIEALATCGNVSGKKGCALVVKSGFSSQKMCRSVMKEMEKQGMVVDYFDVIESVDHAAYVGKKIG